MKFERLQIPDIILCKPVLHKDNRGYFTESFRKDKLEDFLGHSINFCQSNESQSCYAVLRGLHYQIPPYAQTKLVMVTSGKILDVVVDLRKDSLTFGQHISIELSADGTKSLLIPKGFAHGFIVLSEQATVKYNLDNHYKPKFERGIIFNDENLGIDWKIKHEKIKISLKDSKLPMFRDALFFKSTF